MRIAVYAIAKDEEKSARAWADAVREADEVVILDTGSTDRTVEIFREYGYKVYTDYTGPFRFDRARNRALAHVPEDVDWCFSVDIDEIFEPGWRAAIEKAAAENPGANQIRYPFVFSHRTDPDTGEETDDQVFYKQNCHARRGFKWVCPCHEVLVAEGPSEMATADGCRLHHRSEPKPRRGMYLKMLEDGAKEDPNDPRIHYYLGREYLGYRRYQEAADALVRYLDLVGQFCWHDEKGNAIFYIAQACEGLGDLDRAESWALRAIAETDGREPYLFLARIYHQQGRWWESKYYAERALTIEDNKAYFRDTSCYRAAPWDYICACAFKLGDRDRSMDGALHCIEYEPDNKRYRDNAAYFGLIPKGDLEDPESWRQWERERDEADAAARNPEPEKEELAVAYSITDNYAEHLEVALFSLLKHNRVRDLYIIKETGGKDERISQLCKRKGVGRVHWINLGHLLNKGIKPDSPNRNPVVTPAGLGRLFLARATKEKKILYLDCDTIVKGSVSELWNTPMGDRYALAGTIDQGVYQIHDDYTKSLVYGGIRPYLNSGVLLMNLDLMRKKNLDLYAIKLVNETFYSFPDQDVLNIACRERTLDLGNKWNSGKVTGYHPEAVIDHYPDNPRFFDDPNCISWQQTKRELEEYRQQI